MRSRVKTVPSTKANFVAIVKTDMNIRDDYFLDIYVFEDYELDLGRISCVFVT